MGINREKELNYLTNFYKKDQSGLLVVYGQKGIGKTTLLRNFMEDKPSVYYLSREVSEREQLYQMSAELSDIGYSLSEFPDYRQVFHEIRRNHLSGKRAEQPFGKMVLIFDEFQNIILYITSSSGYFNKKFIIDEDININEIISNFKEEVIKYTLDLEEGEN